MRTGSVVASWEVPSRMSARMPAGLESGGQRLWKGVTDGRNLRPDHLRTLLDACREADLIDDLQAAMKGQPKIVLGSQRQQVINPLISEIRQHRATLISQLRNLELADSDTSAQDARRKATQGARALADARWNGKRRSS
jgi:hypothetical protein